MSQTLTPQIPGQPYDRLMTLLDEAYEIAGRANDHANMYLIEQVQAPLREAAAAGEPKKNLDALAFTALAVMEQNQGRLMTKPQVEAFRSVVGEFTDDSKLSLQEIEALRVTAKDPAAMEQVIKGLKAVEKLAGEHARLGTPGKVENIPKEITGNQVEDMFCNIVETLVDALNGTNPTQEKTNNTGRGATEEKLGSQKEL